MGIGLYRRPDGRVSAFVSPKTGPTEGYLVEVDLVPNGGRVDAREIRRLGRFSGEGEIESVLVDDEMGFVYYSDEGAGIRKMSVDPARTREVAILGQNGYKGDREGLGIYATGKGTGFLFSTDQIEGGSITKVYRREGKNELVAELAGGADDTDGIDITSTPLGSAFPYGLWVAMNSGPKTFLVYDGREIRRALGIR
jgi:3-phytase